MIIYIMTDMEGLSGIDRWEQFDPPCDDDPAYRYGREQLTLEINAAIRGAFDAGATEVRICDGHGRNGGRGFVPGLLDPRATQVGAQAAPNVRLEGLDAQVSAAAVIGQHAMAGTLNALFDHTQGAKIICRFRINGVEHGELSQLAMYAGAFGVPMVYASGDEALCDEAQRLFPGIATTPTKRGTGWSTCELYPTDDVRRRIRSDIAGAISKAPTLSAWQPALPAELEIEWAWSEPADHCQRTPGVTRVDARRVRWSIDDARDVYTWPRHRG